MKTRLNMARSHRSGSALAWLAAMIAALATSALPAVAAQASTGPRATQAVANHAATASPDVPAMIGVSFVCDEAAPALCLEDYAGHTASGSPINMEPPVVQVKAEVVVPTNWNGCSGDYLVTSTCPFKSTYWDGHYKGDSMVHLEFPYVGVGGVNGNCVGINGAAVVLRPCMSSGTAWVMAPVDDNRFEAPVNIYTMNQFPSTGDSFVLTGASKGDQARIQTYNGSKLQEFCNTGVVC